MQRAPGRGWARLRPPRRRRLARRPPRRAALAFSSSWEGDPPDGPLAGCAPADRRPGGARRLRGDPGRAGPLQWSDDRRTRRSSRSSRGPKATRVRTPREVDLCPGNRVHGGGTRPRRVPAGPLPGERARRLHALARGSAYLDDARHRPNLTILDRAVADRVLRPGAAVPTARDPRGAIIDLEAARSCLPAARNGRRSCSSAAGWPCRSTRSARRAGRGRPAGGRGSSTTRRRHGLEADAGDSSTTSRPTARTRLFMGQVTVMARSSSCEPDCWDVFLFPRSSPARRRDVGRQRRAFAMKPRSRGRVRARSTDPERPPEIAHGFLIDPADALRSSRART